MSKKTKLADEIASLITAAPTTSYSDDEFEDTKAKVVERNEEDDDDSDIETRVSNIRKQNAGFLDEDDKRYEGKKISRKDVYNDGSGKDSDEDSQYNDSDDEEQFEESNNVSDDDDSLSLDDSKEEKDNDSPSLDDSEEEKDNNSLSLDNSEEEEVSEDSNEEGSKEEQISDNESESDFDRSNPLRRKSKSEPSFTHISDLNVRGEIEKGNCVRNQLNIWENLLEIRIKLQKCLVSSNKMPQYEIHKNFKSDKTFLKDTNETQNKLTGLLDKMLELRKVLLKNYPETRNLNREKPNADANEDPMDEEIPSDTEDEDENLSSEEEGNEKNSEIPRKKLKLSEYEKILSEDHKSYSDYRNSVIQKWNDKTRVSIGNVNKKLDQPVVKQIEFIMNDKTKLLRRSRLKRSDYEIIGKTIEKSEDEDGRRVQEYDSEIYDDDDFYHQLLRELIEYKSSDITDPLQLSKQWIHLQSMRSKMKRKIDTKATKGRRIRYNVHPKLVNFMTPITVYDLWSDESKNELYNSLFGKIKGTEEKNKTTVKD